MKDGRPWGTSKPPVGVAVARKVTRVNLQRFAVSFAVIIGLSGCGQEADAPAAMPPTDAPELSGRVANVWRHQAQDAECRTPDPNSTGRGPSDLEDDGMLPVCAPDGLIGGVYLEGESEADADLSVFDGTKVLVGSAGRYFPGTFADVRPGQTAEVWTSSGVLESDPAQGDIGVIVVSD